MKLSGLLQSKHRRLCEWTFFRLPAIRDYFGRTLCNHLEYDLGVIRCTLDPVLVFKQSSSSQIGMCGIYVDSFLHLGSDQYSTLTKKKEDKVQCKWQDCDRMKFSYVEIETNDSEFYVHQKKNIFNISSLSP